MNATLKIQPHHRSLQALVYIRQSTPKQVLLHPESTKRQYQLAEVAHRWGWPQPQILVIDEDLGLSGARSEQRAGFQRLVASISLGAVGIVLVTEVSRLSRLNSDWHRVIELCAVFQTLIADEDGIYDPRDPNDRLLLGLKGTLFAAELHILHHRMRSSLLNKARRGDLALRLPVGYRRLHDGQAVLEPDEEVRHTLELLFEQFARLKNARAVQRYFYHHQVKMPRLLQGGADDGRIVWVKPTYQMIQQVLTSPVYAGVFVYGRRKREVQPGDPPLAKERRLPLEEWEIVVPAIYPAYIDYERYLANRRLLRDNLYNFTQKGRGAAREGRALLQGIVLCGRCGRRMTVSYGRQYQVYQCRRAQLDYAEAQCQAFAVPPLDQAVSDLFLQAMEPAQLETTLTALAVLEHERQALTRHWQLRLERARYQVQRAQRQYDAAEPENRLVVRELERRWNEALVALQQLEQEYAIVQRTELAPLSEQEQAEVRRLAHDLPALWQAPTTQPVDRKRLLRLAISEVTVTADPATRSADCVILWVGGATTHHHIQRPPQGWSSRTEPSVIECIRTLASRYPDHQIAEQLTAEGIHTRTGKAWTYQRVFSLRKVYRILSTCPITTRQPTARGDGLVSAKTAARLLNVSSALIQLWAHRGVLVKDQRVAASKLWVRVDQTDIARLNGSADCTGLTTFPELMHTQQLSREAVWDLVRHGQYSVYRMARGRAWEWRLRPCEGNAQTA